MPAQGRSEERKLASILYHDGNRHLQDEYDSRRIADRLEEKLCRTAFTPDDTAFIESRPFFFLATADSEGRPDCSFKGGTPGFVRVSGTSELAFPDYDGNGMFKSLGNIVENPSVGLLFIDFEKPRRLRLNGRATISRDDPLIGEFAGAQMVVRVAATAIFPNCPRYIPKMALVETSPYVPAPGVEPVEPGWKSNPDFKDYVHPRTVLVRSEGRAPESTEVQLAKTSP
jgi:predicted pyridoxine 5'-phosphate oxidase superfamily flavin-nucleotide-binding protein